ncbi:MAG: large repetitive protein [Verrucomicrobiota bacterium]|jgi:uncharacterized repeat protein (TIGR01451 family)
MMKRNIFSWTLTGLMAGIFFPSPPAFATTQPGLRETKGKETPAAVRGVATREKISQQLENSFDAGDSYMTPAGKRRLLRLSGAMVVQAKPEERTRENFNQLSAVNGPLHGYTAHWESRGDLTLLQAPRADRERQARDPKLFRDALSKVRRSTGVLSAHPVFVEADTGMARLLTGEILVALKPGTNPKSYFGSEWSKVRALRGAPENFILSRPNATAEALFTEANRRAADRRVAWAQPNFLSQVIKQSVDPLFPAQWALHSAGLNGATAAADVRAPEAWATTSGSPNVVIAVIDDGIEVNHPDLAANIFVNPFEVSNSQDDDANGYVDDVRGWDFFSNDNDATPELPEDKHGTAVAGILSAVANNSLGIAGIAHGCRLMSIKVICGPNWVSDSTLAESIYYAAGRSRDGLSTWRGADVISISLGFPQSAVVDNALTWAATQGRGGKGCPIFVAAGDEASRWRPTRARLPVGAIAGPGTFRFGFEYSKDVSMSIGEDLVRIDNVALVGADGVTHLDSALGPAGRQDFEGAFPPAGWQLSSSLSSPFWFATSSGALTGAGGSTSAQSGALGNGNWTEMRTPAVTLTGNEFLTFSCYVASESDYDGLKVWVYDGAGNYVSVFSGEQDAPMFSGNAGISSGLHYPASHPAVFAVGASTDADRRADYSAYGTGLEFLAPSSGGWNDVVTTDLSGADGYSAGDYVQDFGGTSAACPMAAGIAALMLSTDPTLRVMDVRALLRDSCDRIGGVTYDSGGWNPFYGHGRVNAQRAVAAARTFATGYLKIVSSVPSTPIVPGVPFAYGLSVSNRGSTTATGVVVTNLLPAGVAFVSSTPAPSFGSAGSRLVYQLGDLPAATGLSISIVVMPQAVGVLTNVTTVASAATDPDTIVLLTPVLPSVSISDGTVTEGNAGTTNAIFALRLSARSSQPVSVNFTVAGGSALAGYDYVPVSGTILFPPGTTNQLVRVPVIGDRLSESNLTFFVTLEGAVNAGIARGRAQGTILDNSDPIPAVRIDDVTVTEGDSGMTSAVFDVRLSTRSGRPVTVQYITANGSALANADYVPASGVLTFPPGVINQTISIPVIGDTLSESNETFFVVLTNAGNATIARRQAVGTILDDDALPLMSIRDVAVLEGNSGTTNAVFQVSLSAPSAMVITAGYATTAGSAMAGRDFRPGAGLLKFPPGTTNQTINVPVMGDTLSESNETFLVTLSLPVNANIVTFQATGTILDDDALPALVISDARGVELNAGARNLTFNLRLSVPSGRAVLVDYATADDTAVAGSDYVRTNGTVIFPPGSILQSVRVPVLGNLTSESNETFFVNLSAPVNATISDGHAVGSIVDNDRVPALFINDVTVTEGNTGVTNAVFTVRLSVASERFVSVGYTTSNHTAHAGVDYAAASGTIVFAPGTTNQLISIGILGDTLLETNRDFFVNLANPTNATVAHGRGVGTILDNDFVITTTFHPASTSVGTNYLSDFKISSARIVGTNVVITFPTFAGRVIRLEYCDGALGSTNAWQDVPGATNITGLGETITAIHHGGASHTMRFYRGRLSP